MSPKVGPQAGDLGMVFFPGFWKVPDVQPLMTHIEATSKPILESITAETGVIWPPLEEFEAEWAHLQKGENKRTVPQRAKPFRNAHNCSLTRVYLGTCSGTDYKTATVEIVRSGTVYCSGTVYTVPECAEQGANPHSHSRQETDRRKIRRAGRQSDQSDEKEGGSHGGVPTHSSCCKMQRQRPQPP